MLFHRYIINMLMNYSHMACINSNTKNTCGFLYDIDNQTITKAPSKNEKSHRFPFASHFGCKTGLKMGSCFAFGL